MALISCPECSHQVSELAPTCPSCGFPIAAAVTDRRIALRICPDCQGTGKGEEPCPMCMFGTERCPKCRGIGNWLGDPCPDCGGEGYYPCQSCSGRGHFICACPSCNNSGEVSLEDYEVIVRAKEAAEEARCREEQAKRNENQQKEAEVKAAKLTALNERLSEVKGELLQLGLVQGATLLSDSAYAVDRAKIMKIYGEQLQALRIHRFQCQFCGEPLERKERLRRLQVHDKQDCKEGWDRVSKQIAENNSGYEKFMRENAPRIGDEG